MVSALPCAEEDCRILNFRIRNAALRMESSGPMIWTSTYDLDDGDLSQVRARSASGAGATEEIAANCSPGAE